MRTTTRPRQTTSQRMRAFHFGRDECAGRFPGRRDPSDRSYNRHTADPVESPSGGVASDTAVFGFYLLNQSPDGFPSNGRYNGLECVKAGVSGLFSHPSYKTMTQSLQLAKSRRPKKSFSVKSWRRLSPKTKSN